MSESTQSVSHTLLLHKQNWNFPCSTKNHEENSRRVGVEIEFSGISCDDVLEAVTDTLGGDVQKNSAFDFDIQNTEAGDIKLELDAQILKQVVASSNDEADESKESKLKQLGEQLLAFTAELLVPWEIVSAPLTTNELPNFNKLIKALRKQGALGTRHAARYAFGVHLNPELPELSAKVILAYLQSFVVLYDWLYQQERVDLARKLTPYIDHYNKEYIELITQQDYEPNLEQLIKDYIRLNPTRNRTLDCLPLFAHIDEKYVKGLEEDDLIKPRPTLHYRLPNCDIDNNQWDLSKPWALWQVVEQVAHNDELRHNMMQEFRADLQRLTRVLDDEWVKQTHRLLDKAGLLELSDS